VGYQVVPVEQPGTKYKAISSGVLATNGSDLLYRFVASADVGQI